MKIELSGRELNHVISLVSNDVKKRRRAYDKPRAVKQREEYFARPENAAKADVAVLHIENGEALLGRLKLARAAREAQIRAKLFDAAVELARDFGASAPNEVGERADDCGSAYADLLADATNAVQDAYGVGEEENEDDAMEWMEAAHKAADGAGTMRALLEGIASEMRLK